MTKKIAILTALIAAAATLLPAIVDASTIAGRVTAFSGTSMSISGREIVTVGINSTTVFTKLVTQKPWQEDTTLQPGAVRVGTFVVAHVPENGGFVANWVQVATDFSFVSFTPVAPIVAPTAFATAAERHRAEAAALRVAPNASESKRPGSPGTAVHCDRIADRLDRVARLSAAGASPATATAAPVAQASAADILPSKEVRELIANAKTPADHRKLAKHFAAVAARYDAEAADHAAEAKAYRSAPTASESKRPGGPDTAVHCDRLADAARNGATAARDLARDHERMAK